jgi:hypothetical protein
MVSPVAADQMFCRQAGSAGVLDGGGVGPAHMWEEGCMRFAYLGSHQKFTIIFQHFINHFQAI